MSIEGDFRQAFDDVRTFDFRPKTWAEMQRLGVNTDDAEARFWLRLPAQQYRSSVILGRHTYADRLNKWERIRDLADQLDRLLVAEDVPIFEMEEFDSIKNSLEKLRLSALMVEQEITKIVTAPGYVRPPQEAAEPRKVLVAGYLRIFEERTGKKATANLPKTGNSYSPAFNFLKLVLDEVLTEATPDATIVRWIKEFGTYQTPRK